MCILCFHEKYKPVRFTVLSSETTILQTYKLHWSQICTCTI